ncbi:hypothetical protein LR48_Vigan08g065100 [Vigna angularis]|uniref:MYND-type domain-containing protein n=2 Tax=Phaseolus angularis TaxID=3914 RepID=A0A0L9V539_PHAAN|nr:uncharacterized protein LOC128196457 isoform X2 [Vigna angularis]KOM49824.1 hypothetical protein LR48_Vigan08g065100 [Vigna angularis]BAT89735.1 hypothetical protein VIGAN_06077300 [Vigna angularis var. angularis]
MNVYGLTLTQNCVLMIIVFVILPFLGLLFWLENKLSNNNSSEDNHLKEQVQISDERNNYIFCGQDSAHCACSFCGRLCSTVTTCSRCKTAIYCSKTCNFKHWRLVHRYECVEIEGSEDQQESPSHECLIMEKHSSNEVEERIYEGDVYYIDGGENSDERSLMCGNGIVNGNEGCAVCGNPSSKVCSRCKAIKYCSRTCQHFDWRSGHKLQCLVEKEYSNQVVNHLNSYEVEDNVHSSSPLCLEFFSGNTSSRALIPTSLSHEATKNPQKEVEEQLRSLKEELTKIKDENKWLRSERDEWEVRTRNSIDRLYSFRKENEHQLFILKHENELMSNAEKQATQMVNSLSRRVHCLQIAVESGVEERQKQEEYIHMLQNECAKVKIELQEQKKSVQRLTLELEKSKVHVRVTEDTRQKLVSASSEIPTVEYAAGAEVSQPISLSRNLSTTRQGCSICLTNEKNMAFGCGHMTCLECGSKIRKCHICRMKITNRIRLFLD